MSISISEKTADVAKKALSRAIDKKVWIKENKPEVVDEKFQARYQAELDAYEELRKALLGE